MATQYHSKIPGVTKGLTHFWDAANIKSYTNDTLYDMVDTTISGSLQSGSYHSGFNKDSNITFDASNDRVLLNKGNYTILMGNGNLPWTVCAWVKHNITSGYYSVIGQSNGGPAYGSVGIVGGKMAGLFYYTGPWYYVTGSTTVSDNTWKMLTWIQKDNYYMDGYVNTTLDMNNQFSRSNNNNPWDVIGNYWSQTGFGGQIAVIHIYNRNLSVEEITLNYNSLKNRFGV